MTPCKLDVRPLLARGEEPFAAIMSAVDALAPGQPLCLIAPFRPVPLFNVMSNRGFACSDRALEGGDWEVIFTPVSAVEPGLAPGSASAAAFWPEPAEVLDLTGLAPPEPMVRILETLEAMEPGAVLFALLDREPMFLFPELAQRGHEWAGNLAADGTCYRLLARRGGDD
ncbi:DUF2249 domain-containing protein [Tabrizicola sp. SY72]|nr:DUF2249 domain-containing protein [Tabrizicola sp. SY72]